MMTRYEKEQKAAARRDELLTCIINAFFVFVFGEFSLWTCYEKGGEDILLPILGLVCMAGSLIVILEALRDMERLGR